MGCTSDVLDEQVMGRKSDLLNERCADRAMIWTSDGLDDRLAG
jgi:hypothetical protein